MASKLIGLPQYADAMQRLQRQSTRWGIAAVVLEIIALASGVLAEDRRDFLQPSAQASLTYPFEQNRWMNFIQHRFIRLALVAVGTLALVVVFAVVIYVAGAIVYR
jgi:hypothetical protein